MEPDGQAIVRVMNHGAGGSRFMVYEDGGAWNMRATADFAAHLGQPPLQRIISEEKAAGLCDS